MGMCASGTSERMELISTSSGLLTTKPKLPSSLCSHKKMTVLEKLLSARKGSESKKSPFSGAGCLFIFNGINAFFLDVVNYRKVFQKKRNSVTD